jgi:hypothetical protein
LRTDKGSVSFVKNGFLCRIRIAVRWLKIVSAVSEWQAELNKSSFRGPSSSFVGDLRVRRRERYPTKRNSSWTQEAVSKYFLPYMMPSESGISQHIRGATEVCINVVCRMIGCNISKASWIGPSEAQPAGL